MSREVKRMRYVCQLCGYVYDDEKEAVPFAELPDDWTCPLCGAPKSLFEAQGEPEPVEETTAANTNVESVLAESGIDLAFDDNGDMMAGLSAGQLAALCSNLARGCEKQDKLRESELFTQIADSFITQVKPIDGAGIQDLAELLLGDSERYAAARTAAEAAGDRGTLRIITWGERITNMLSYLVGRYQSEGDSFLEDTEIWVCTVCGFIYVGDEAPDLCPVCKVPSWKFQKMVRRAS